MRRTFLLMALALSVAVLGCGSMLESKVQPKATVDRGIEDQLPPYSGPKASVAVARFEWKVGGGSTTRISGPMGNFEVSHSQQGYMTGLQDMLTTALMQSKRYRVVERGELGSVLAEQDLAASGRVSKKTGAKKGKVRGADILVVAAITGWEPGTSGTKGGVVGGGLLGTAGVILGGIAGSYQKSSMAMDIRIIDSNTSEVLAATRVEGEASDINLGGLAGGIMGGVGMGGGLSGYAKTPMEKAIRTCINESVKYVVENTPKQYFKH